MASPPGLQGQPDHRLALGCIYISAAEGELEKGPALLWDAGASGACQVTLPVPPALRGCVRPSAWHPDSVEPPALYLLASLAQGLLQPPVCRSLSWLQMTSSLVLPTPSFSRPGWRAHPPGSSRWLLPAPLPALRSFTLCASGVPSVLRTESRAVADLQLS